MMLVSVLLSGAVDLELVTHVLQGNKPEVVVLVNDPVSEVVLSLRREGAPTLERRWRLPKPGSHLRVVLDAPPGKSRYAGKLTVKREERDDDSMPVAFEVEVAAPMTLGVREADVDLAAGRLLLRASRALGRCTGDFILDGAADMHREEFYSQGPADVALAFAWQPPAALVLKITLTCYDSQDIFSVGLELYPWHISVAHEEVVFDSGKWAIAPSESEKLARAYTEIAAAVERYGKLLSGVTLYISGHTDTVGDAGYNHDLSGKRARAIAEAFRRLGVRIPVRYAGFGEEHLVVATADETDEAANRRADYTIGVNPPGAANWRGL
jgi:outer membrane protein OmpA-like peptidoglycan-associated protein